MEIVDNLETAAGTVLGAIEHPFHTIGERLKAAGEHLAEFLCHPYAAPPLQLALTALHGVVKDLAQEVAELRKPCECDELTDGIQPVMGLYTPPPTNDAAPQTFKDRAKAEAEDLLKKRTALGFFIQSAAFDSVPPAEQQRLNAQAAAMTDYQVALQARIDADFGA